MANTANPGQVLPSRQRADARGEVQAKEAPKRLQISNAATQRSGMADNAAMAEQPTKALVDGEPYPVPDYHMVGEPLILLLVYVVLFMLVVIGGRWQLSRPVGVALLGCQALYTTWTVLRNFPTGAAVIQL